MAKLITLILVLIVLQACLLLFNNTNIDTQTDTNPWDFVTNIDNWNSLTFVLGFVGIALGIGIVGFAIGSYIGFKTDFVMLAVAIPGLLSLGLILVNFGNVLRNFLISTFFVGCGGVNPQTCAPATWLVAISVGTIAIFYVWTVVDWWRGRDG